MEISVDCGTSMNKNGTLTTTIHLPNTREGSIYQNKSTEEPCEPTDHLSLHGEDVRDGAMTRQLEDMVIFIHACLVLAFVIPKVLP